MAKRHPFKRPAAAAITPKAPRKKPTLESEQKPPPDWAERLKESEADNILQASLKHFLSKLPTALKESFWHAAGKQWVLASACTGTGMAELAHHVIMEFRGVPSTIELCSEKVKFKQAFIANVVQKSLGEESCIFEEMGDLPSGQGACATHGSLCAVPRGANMFICGFSCKDLSRLSNKFNGAARDTVLKMGMGTSGGTFQAVLGYAKLVRPAIVILENVDEMMRENSPNVTYLHQAFADIEYAGASKVMNSSDYGLPQARVRAWFVILDLRRFGCAAVEAQAMAQTMLSRTELFKTSPRSLESMCLKEQDPRLDSELARRQESAKGDCSAGTTWFETHRNFFKTKGLTWQGVKLPPSADFAGKSLVPIAAVPGEASAVLRVAACGQHHFCRHLPEDRPLVVRTRQRAPHNHTAQ